MLYSQNPDAIVMGKVVEIITGSQGGIRDIISAIFPKLPSIIMMIIVKKFVENSSEMFANIYAFMHSWFKKMCYTTKLIEGCTNGLSKEFYLKESYDKKLLTFQNQTIPMYWEYHQDQKAGELSYCGWHPHHNSIISECLTEATKEHAIKTKTKTSYKKMSVSSDFFKYCTSVSSKLYPSKNYTNLVSVIKTHTAVAKLVKSYSVLGILIDGVAGLGKTKFADFAVEEKIVGNVYKVDMTTMLNTPFSKAVGSIYHNIDIVTDTIFVIDEIDKYLDVRITKEISIEDQHKEKKKNKALASLKEDDKPQPEDNQGDEESIDTKKLIERIKTEFLYDMLSILERDGLGFSVIVIFCSNNFCSIFEGVDLTHHKSLYDRFMKIKFKECSQIEIIDYMLYYNEQFRATEFYLELDKENMKSLLRDDISITHRTLHHISIKAKYNAYEMIKLLNNYVGEDDSGESLVDQMEKLRKKDTKEEPLLLEKKIIEAVSKSIYPEIIPKVVHTISKDSDDDEEDRYDVKGNLKTHSNSYTDLLNQIGLPEMSVEEGISLWQNKFTKLTGNKKEINANIQEFLNRSEEAIGKQNKAVICIELFDYLAIEGYHVMNMDEYLKFATVTNAKIAEFARSDPQIFPLMESRTKEFIAASLAMFGF